MWPVVHLKDDEEDEEGEMMSDHMKDSEVRFASPFSLAGCVLYHNNMKWWFSEESCLLYQSWVMRFFNAGLILGAQQ